MNEHQAYEYILGRELPDNETWQLLQLYEPPSLEPLGEPGSPLATMRRVREEFAEDIEDELDAIGDEFWEDQPEEVLAIEDEELRAFVVGATRGTLAPKRKLSQCEYVRDLLPEDDPRFVIAWEAVPPLHDLAYCIIRLG